MTGAVLQYGVDPMLESPLQTAVTTPLMFGAGALPKTLGFAARMAMAGQMAARPAQYVAQRAAEATLPKDVRAMAEADPSRISGPEAAVDAGLAAIPTFAEALHRAATTKMYRYTDPPDLRSTASGAGQDWKNSDVFEGRRADIHRERDPTRLLGNRADYGSEPQPKARYAGPETPVTPDEPDFHVTEDAENRAKLTEVERRRGIARDRLEEIRKGPVARVAPDADTPTLPERDFEVVSDEPLTGLKEPPLNTLRALATEAEGAASKPDITQPTSPDWLGKSKAVDSQGNPLVLYHGTQGEFEIPRPSTSGQFGPAIYTTDSPDEAKAYSTAASAVGDTPSVKRLHVRIENPLILKAKNLDGPPRHWFDEFGPQTQESVDHWKALGYDGVIAEQPRVLGGDSDNKPKLGEWVRHYIPFDADQVRAAPPEIGEGVGGASAPGEPPGEQRARMPRRPANAAMDLGLGEPAGVRRRTAGGVGGGGMVPPPPAPPPGATPPGNAGGPVPPRGNPPPSGLHVAAAKFLKIGDDFKKLFAADTRGPESAMAGAIMRQNAGWVDRNAAQARHHTRAFAQSFDRIPEPDRSAPTHDVMANPRMEFMQAIEEGRRAQLGTLTLPKPSPWLPGNKAPSMVAAASAVRDMLDHARDQVIATGTGALKTFYEEYFPHIWEDPARAQSVVASILAKRPYEGSKSFLKQRTLMTTRDGIEAGLWPVSTNPIDLALMKTFEMRKYVEAHRSWAEFAKKGLIRFVAPGSKFPPGWAPMNDKMAKIFGGAGGQWIAPEPVAHVFNQFLAPGMRGNGVYDAYMLGANALNMAQLGLSWFHGGLMVMESAMSDLALAGEKLSHLKTTQTVTQNGPTTTTVTTKRPNVGGLLPLARGLVPGASLVNDLRVGNNIMRAYLDPASANPIYRTMAAEVERAGGRAHMDQAWDAGQMRALGKDVRTGKYGTAIMRILPAGWEAAVAPIMRGVVPRVKLAAFGRLAFEKIEQLGPNPTDEEMRFAVQGAWNSIDNRAGQYVYRNKFWNPYWKDAMHAMVRATGWTGGTIGEVGGGTLDFARMGRDVMKGQKPTMTSRSWYTAALFLGAAWFGAVLQYALTGEGPKGIHDLYYPRTGKKNAEGNDERLQLPTYMRDVTSWTSHPGRTAINKLNPLVHAFAEIAQNRDFYGDKIFGSHRDESPPEKAIDWTKELGSYALNRGVKPFVIRNMEESGKREQSAGVRALSYAGVTPASREATRSAAQNRLMDILDERGQTPAEPADKAHRQAMSDMKSGLREHRATGDSLFGAQLDSGNLSTRAARTMFKKSLDPVWTERFKQLSIPDAVDVFKMGDAAERTAWRVPLLKKIHDARRAKTIAPRDLPEIMKALRVAGEP